MIKTMSILNTNNSHLLITINRTPQMALSNSQQITHSRMTVSTFQIMKDWFKVSTTKWTPEIMSNHSHLSLAHNHFSTKSRKYKLSHYRIYLISFQTIGLKGTKIRHQTWSITGSFGQLKIRSKILPGTIQKAQLLETINNTFLIKMCWVTSKIIWWCWEMT